MALESINPATGERLDSYAEMSRDAVADAIRQTHEAFVAWRQRSFDERAKPMRETARLLRERAELYGRLMALEMGKPLRDGMAEAQKCAVCCEFYADNAARMLARETVPTEAHASFIAFNPLGVVLAVMPWNFPFWQVIRCAAPALMAGNAIVLKHASSVPGCALALEELFREAGFPHSLIRALMIGSGAVDAVIEHPLVRAVSVTGSVATGRAVATKAGAALK